MNGRTVALAADIGPRRLRASSIRSHTFVQSLHLMCVLLPAMKVRSQTGFHQPTRPAKLPTMRRVRAAWSLVTQVCDAAGVPLEVVPLTDEYWDRVVSHSLAEARAGRTPNPDVWCNSRCVACPDSPAHETSLVSLIQMHAWRVMLCIQRL